ncbi:protein FAM169B isoform X2 [Scyliorhinus canicula]|uniref:protein FAM169B isoform X2 n=1 Tax=Scyliorhinus canicula TaxID=7830 RepID=UPI0018F33492|nr:protein FAM169B isoform X2 [Scyliorhinus canicula]
MEIVPTLTERVTSYPVDILTNRDWDALKQSSEAYLSRLSEGDEESIEWFCLTNGEQLPVTPSAVTFLHVHKEVSEHRILALLHRQDNQAVVALYLGGRWWSLADTLRTSNSARRELVQVQSVAEQIVLYLLNRIIYRKREFLPGNPLFLHHSANQFAKVFWKDGEAVGFYTVQQKGSLCTDHTSQCYQLPVLDTVFVRRTHQRQGIALKILQDFCCTFCEDEAVGISRPISAAMYKVCSKYLPSRPRDQDCLWEVEAPGDWSQRVNVWLQIQMGDVPSVNSAGGGNSSLHSPGEERSQGSTDGDIIGQSPRANACDPHPEVILEPSEAIGGLASDSQALTGQSSGESNMIEGKKEEARSEADTATGRRRRDTGLLEASNLKQVKLTAPPLCD